MPENKRKTLYRTCGYCNKEVRMLIKPLGMDRLAIYCPICKRENEVIYVGED